MLAHSFLELDEGHPCLFPRAPFHPSLKHISAFLVLAYEFFHVGILKPKLVLSRKVVDGPFPHVARMVDEFILHLHLSILKPKAFVSIVYF